MPKLLDLIKKEKETPTPKPPPSTPKTEVKKEEKRDETKDKKSKRITSRTNKKTLAKKIYDILMKDAELQDKQQKIPSEKVRSIYSDFILYSNRSK